MRYRMPELLLKRDAHADEHRIERFVVLKKYLSSYQPSLC